jgi:hypothetical protein
MAKRSKNKAEAKPAEDVQPEPVSQAEPAGAAEPGEPTPASASEAPSPEPPPAPVAESPAPSVPESAASEPLGERAADSAPEKGPGKVPDPGGADGAVICNNGGQNEVLILGGHRKMLKPREIWRVPGELMAAFDQYVRTPYFQAILASGLFAISTVATGRMRDPEVKSVKTPAPPPSINPEVPYGNKKTTVKMELEA